VLDTSVDEVVVREDDVVLREDEVLEDDVLEEVVRDVELLDDVVREDEVLQDVVREEDELLEVDVLLVVDVAGGPVVTTSWGKPPADSRASYRASSKVGLSPTSAKQ
jgi:hypothetical protein